MMMFSRDFKFRHANEIAGLFVLLAFALLIAGIFFAARSQDWFAPTISLHLVFDTPEGAFGLKEGAPVQVRNTAAGRVLMLEPTEDGKIRAGLRVREEFRSFITVDSKARVKRTFGVAGDAFVDIVPGSGALIEDGDVLQAVKDEELTEMAQRVLGEFQATLTPVLEQVGTIISNTASILVRVDQGEGLVGALIRDEAMRDRTSGILVQAEGITREARGVVGQVTNLLQNEVHAIAQGTVSVQDELAQTLAESRRVVEAVQRHWLIRKYVEDEDDRLPLLPGYPMFAPAQSVQADLLKALSEARRADDAEAIVRCAYNMAVYALSVDQLALAESLLFECLVAARQFAQVPVEARLLQSELYRLSGDLDRAQQYAQNALEVALDNGRKGRATAVQARLMLSSLALDRENLTGAREYLKDAKKTRGDTLDDSLFQASLMGLAARIAFSQGQLTKAGRHYSGQADQLRSHGAYGPMAVALIRSADLFYNAGSFSTASENYLRAASSLFAQQEYRRSLSVLELAERAATEADDPMLIKRVADLQKNYRARQ